MKKEEIEIVKECLQTYGDDFWTDSDEDGVLTPNIELIYDIISCVNQAGYDLRLIKLEC